MADAAQSSSANDLGALPEWNLADLYPGTESEALFSDLDAAAGDAKSFKAQYAGKVATLSGAELGAAIAAYEKIDEIIGRVMSYAQLVYAGDMSSSENGKFSQSMRERATEIGSDLLFFGLEINRIEDADLEEKLKTPELARYQPWLRDVRVFRPHQLSDELEEMLHEKSVAGRGAWMRLFDETMAGLRFEHDGKELTAAEVLDRLSHKDAKEREAAARSLSKVLGENVKLFALITNTLAKDKEVEDKWRHYDRPISSRNRVNQVEDEVVDALVDAVAKSYPRLSHRYYALKAKWFGVEALDFWDRNAPLPDDDDSVIRWDEAERTVLEAYGAFSPKLAEIGSEFFKKNWIDAPVRPGKASGAFSHPTVPTVHPYILMNYQGKTRDVMTLAHELGHGVHQVLAADQGHLQADTPLTLAETASVFGEMLTFRSMLAARKDPKERRIMLASKVEDMLNTVVRQIAFHQFETRVHDQRREGELTPEAIGDIWMDIQGESLGPAIRFDDDYRVFWTYIPHFIHSPFYVYAYAFGDCLVNSLYAVYQDAEQGFAEKYLKMLSAGGTLRHKELLAPFGLDAGDPAFWNKGLSVIEGFIDELEAME
ncbi:MAG: M3 family oligoendopeptidase [Alphaproteobacteria bacterium]|jgi:oligoendopeptidase F|nr:M3 family oligoendopeptidase [Alphaproteobacteria bacterium]